MIPTLHTERLTLRGPRESDLGAMAAFGASDRARYIGGPISRWDSWRNLLMGIGHWTLRGYGYWSVDLSGTGEFIGRCGVIFHDGWPEPELAWHFYEGNEGKGYASEAAKAARAHAYREMGFPTLISMMDQKNDRSIRLAERLGATRERGLERDGKPYFLYRHPGPEGLA